jgi:hypothetical protein
MLPNMKKPVFTDDELNEEMDNEIGVVSKILEGHPTGYNPMLHIVSWDATKGSLSHILIALDVDFNEADEKYQAMEGIGGMCAEKKIIVLAVILTSEAWLRAPKKNPDGTYSYGEIQDEVVIVNACTYDKRIGMAIIPIVRREEDNAIIGRFSEVQVIKYDPKSGKTASGDLMPHFWKGYALKALEILEQHDTVKQEN